MANLSVDEYLKNKNALTNPQKSESKNPVDAYLESKAKSLANQPRRFDEKITLFEKRIWRYVS